MKSIFWASALFLLWSLTAVAQVQRPNLVEGTRYPVAGTFRPGLQLSATRLIALVPVVDVPGAKDARAPLFLEMLDSPTEEMRATSTKKDSSKADVPAGIISFRAMYSDDGQWALIDVHAREASGLLAIRNSRDARVRILTPDDVRDSDVAKRVSLPKGLNLPAFLAE